MQFTWLYFFSLLAALRGLLFLRLGMSGWEGWMGGAVTLLITVGLMRQWGRYVLTSERIIIRNGYTGRDIQSLPLKEIGEISIIQGWMADYFHIGNLVIRSSRDDQVMSLKGVYEPEVIKHRIDALR